MNQVCPAPVDGCVIVDLDGTLMKWGSNTPLPGALEELLRFKQAGGQIIFVTQRREDDSDFDMLGLFKFMMQNFPDSPILYRVRSPRIVINDAGAIAINHSKNSPWSYDLVRMAQENG